MQAPLTFFMSLKFLIFLIMSMIGNVSRIRDSLILNIGSKHSLLGMALRMSYSVKIIYIVKYH